MSFAVIEIGELLIGVTMVGFRRLAIGCVVLCHLQICDRYVALDGHCIVVNVAIIPITC